MLCTDTLSHLAPAVDLWDHRNGSMLQDFLINEFVLNPRTGLGNPNVDGFYFDDGWTKKPSAVPPWAPPTYKQCDMWKTGGATEEDYYCSEDRGLSQGDVDAITAGHAELMGKVEAAILSNDGFGWPYLTPRIGGLPSLDLNDPRPTCAKHLRESCAGAYLNKTLLFEFTRKKFHDAFPLPFVTQDLAQFLLVRGPCESNPTPARPRTCPPRQSCPPCVCLRARGLSHRVCASKYVVLPVV